MVDNNLRLLLMHSCSSYAIMGDLAGMLPVWRMRNLELYGLACRNDMGRLSAELWGRRKGKKAQHTKENCAEKGKQMGI